MCLSYVVIELIRFHGWECRDREYYFTAFSRRLFIRGINRAQMVNRSVAEISVKKRDKADAAIIKRWNWRVSRFDLTEKYEILLYPICTFRLFRPCIFVFENHTFGTRERKRERGRMIFYELGHTNRNFWL